MHLQLRLQVHPANTSASASTNNASQTCLANRSAFAKKHLKMHVRPESHLIFILIADLLQSRLQMRPENASTNAIETGDTNASAIEAANASTNASHEHICKYIFQMHLQMHVRPEVQMSLQSRMQMHPAKPSASASCKWCLASMSCKFISKCT